MVALVGSGSLGVNISLLLGVSLWLMAISFASLLVAMIPRGMFWSMGRMESGALSRDFCSPPPFFEPGPGAPCDGRDRGAGGGGQAGVGGAIT